MKIDVRGGERGSVLLGDGTARQVGGRGKCTFLLLLHYARLWRNDFKVRASCAEWVESWRIAIESERWFVHEVVVDVVWWGDLSCVCGSPTI